MKVYGIIVNGLFPQAGKFFLYSRASHDFRTFGECSIDGGQPVGYNSCRIIYEDKRPEEAWFDLKVNSADLYNDWNNNKDRLGIIALEECGEKVEQPDITSLEWKIEHAIWGTYGKTGLDPFRYINLKDCTLNHLKKIAKESNVSEDYLKIIKFLLKQKEEKQSDV